MGHCYSFATQIEQGCDHAMMVADMGGACVCPTCGAHCTGKFRGCAVILEQPGYVPAEAPAWALEYEPGARVHDGNGTGKEGVPGEELVLIAEAPIIETKEAIEDLRAEIRELVDNRLIDAIRDFRASLSASLAGVLAREQASLRDSIATEVVERVKETSGDLRSDIVWSVDESRRELEEALKRQTNAIEQLTAALDGMTHKFETEHTTLRGVVEGLDRIAKRIRDLERPSATIVVPSRRKAQ